LALKIPHREKITSPDHCALFLRDAATAYSVQHAHILPLLDYGFWQEDLPFSATRHIRSPNLKQFARKSGLPDESAMKEVLLQICQAVGFAHEQRVLHRHLNPNNIFIEQGPCVLVSDFCIHYDGRYHFGLQEPLRNPNPFESPEAINNNPDFIDKRSDIFAIGKILKLLLRITSEMDHSQRAAWETIQTKCTKTRRRDRYQSVRAVVDAVKKL
jgi:serine/threonine protein kinase